MKIKSFLVWLSGFAIGGVVGGYFVGMNCAKQYRQKIVRLENEISNLTYEETETETDISEPEKKEEKSEEPEEDAPKIDYVKLSKQYRSEAFNEHFADRAHPEDDEPEQENEETIYVVDYDTFNQMLENSSWEKMTWYQAEDILVDEVGDIVYDEAETLGQETIDILANTKDEIVYVLNETRNHLYEVTVDHNSEFPYVPEDFSDSLYRDVMI